MFDVLIPAEETSGLKPLAFPVQESGPSLQMWMWRPLFNHWMLRKLHPPPPSFRRWQAPPIRGETQQITLQNTRHRSAFKSLLLNHISRKSDSTFFLFVLFFTKVRAGAETNPSWLSGFVWWSCLSLCQNEKEKENRKVSKTNKKKTVSTEN